jgi:thiamine kinase-like enzyme
MALETGLPQGVQQVLEAVEALSEEEQWMVVEIIANRLRRLRRQQLVEEVEEARSAYQRGEARRGSVDDLLRDLGE